MNKVIRDNHVAVLVSGNWSFSTGQASWSTMMLPCYREQSIFDPFLVTLLESVPGWERDPLHSQVQKHIQQTYKPVSLDVTTKAALYCDVRWVPVGLRFRIIPVDGHSKAENEILEIEYFPWIQL